MTKPLSLLVVLIGLLVITWSASSFVGTNPLALGVTLMIAALFLTGYFELVRYQANTATLRQVITNTKSSDQTLSAWLGQIPDALKNAVQHRIEGAYRPLPQPTLTPYLTGLLVMLGLLGTFIGMVATLEGAVTALEGNTELEAIRNGLAAPMKGLGMAFGTSVAGVCGSACLGLISTLSRRDRSRASQLLDECAETYFQEHSLDHDRRETYAALKQQAQLLPDVATQLTKLSQQLTENTAALHDGLLQNQDNFLKQSSDRLEQLTEKVERSVSQTLPQAAQQALDNTIPLFERMSQKMGNDWAATHEQLSEALRQQLDALQQSSSRSINDLQEQFQQPLNKWVELAERNNQSLQAVCTELGQVRQHHDTLHQQLSDRHQQLQDDMVESQKRLLDDSQSRLQHIDRAIENSVNSMTQMESAFGDHMQAVQQQLGQLETTLQEQLLQRQASFLDTTAQQYNHLAEQVSQSLQTALADGNRLVLEGIQPSLTSLIEQFNQLLSSTQTQFSDHLQHLVNQLNDTLAKQLSDLRDDESQRASALREQLQHLHLQAVEQLQHLGDGLQQPLQTILNSAQENTSAIAQLMTTLQSECARLSEKDDHLLEERETLLTSMAATQRALNEQAREQHQVLMTTIETATEGLTTVAERFTEHVASDMAQLKDSMDQFSTSSVELSSLSDSFHVAVGEFSTANSGLQQCLQNVEAALNQAGERNNEQLAYYVAQAREIIDHNLHSQQEIINQLRQMERERNG